MLLLFSSPSLPPSLHHSLTDSHTHTHTLSLTHTHTLSLTHVHSLTHSLSLTFSSSSIQGLTPLEWRTQFSLWAISAAPLWAGIDLSNMSQTALDIFLNKEVIAIDQDALGVQGTLRPSHSVADPQQSVTLQNCSSPYASSWFFNSSDSSIRAHGQCLTVEACALQPGGNIITYDCVGQSGGCPKNQQFAPSRSSRGVRLISSISSLCVAAPHEEAETIITQQSCADDNDTLWSILSSGQIALTNSPTLCLAVGGPVHARGEVWARPLVSLHPGEHRVAVVLFNADPSTAQIITVSFSDVWLDGNAPVAVRDVWEHEEKGSFQGSFSVSVEPHGASMVLLVQQWSINERRL